ncbi:hypothetical protein CA13_69350 [Planctomycetes bacterium CA13]|uniref:Uncharacterized protein n=1 Tax=Novipirellula herctigrandis TaxID=2527986 RepID=A0A5C5YND1_9BACT|nr:hypothetical protein CA13_69350 [Planctomycetes bacterium CA13]
MLKPFHALLFAAATLTLPVSADADSNPTFGGGNTSGIRVEMVRHENNPAGSALSDWHLRLNNSQAVLHWVAIPFTHSQSSQLQSDATLSARVKSQKGPIKISPSAIIDSTNLRSGDEQASINLFAQGAGRASIELQVGIDQQHAAAGTHCTTVILSVTAP